MYNFFLQIYIDYFENCLFSHQYLYNYFVITYFIESLSDYTFSNNLIASIVLKFFF